MQGHRGHHGKVSEDKHCYLKSTTRYDLFFKFDIKHERDEVVGSPGVTGRGTGLAGSREQRLL